MIDTKWYGFEMNKRKAEIFREYLIKNDIYYEPSEAYNIIHFECKMTEKELRDTEQWFKKTLLGIAN